MKFKRFINKIHSKKSSNIQNMYCWDCRTVIGNFYSLYLYCQRNTASKGQLQFSLALGNYPGLPFLSGTHEEGKSAIA